MKLRHIKPHNQVSRRRNKLDIRLMRLHLNRASESYVYRDHVFTECFESDVFLVLTHCKTSCYPGWVRVGGRSLN